MTIFLYGHKVLSIRPKIDRGERRDTPEGRVREDVADGELAAARFDRVFRVDDAVVRDDSSGDLSPMKSSVNV